MTKVQCEFVTLMCEICQKNPRLKFLGQKQGEYGKHQKDDLNTLFMTKNTPAVNRMTRNTLFSGNYGDGQGGITCGAIDEPRKSSKAIDRCVIIDFATKMS